MSSSLAFPAIGKTTTYPCVDKERRSENGSDLLGANQRIRVLCNPLGGVDSRVLFQIFKYTGDIRASINSSRAATVKPRQYKAWFGNQRLGSCIKSVNIRGLGYLHCRELRQSLGTVWAARCNTPSKSMSAAHPSNRFTP